MKTLKLKTRPRVAPRLQRLLAPWAGLAQAAPSWWGWGAVLYWRRPMRAAAPAPAGHAASGGRPQAPAALFPGRMVARLSTPLVIHHHHLPHRTSQLWHREMGASTAGGAVAASPPWGHAFTRVGMPVARTEARTGVPAGMRPNLVWPVTRDDMARVVPGGTRAAGAPPRLARAAAAVPAAVAVARGTSFNAGVGRTASRMFSAPALAVPGAGTASLGAAGVALAYHRPIVRTGAVSTWATPAGALGSLALSASACRAGTGAGLRLRSSHGGAAARALRVASLKADAQPLPWRPSGSAAALVWRRSAAGPDTGAAAVPSAATARVPPAVPDVGGHAAAVGSDMAARFASVPPPTVAVAQGVAVERLADAVLQRIERRMRIERERRGL